MKNTTTEAVELVATESEAVAVIEALAEKFGIKTHVWGSVAIEGLLEEAGIDVGVDVDELPASEKAKVISEFKETQAWQETGLDIDIAMQDELIAILSKY